MTETRYIRIAVVDEAGREHLAQDVGPFDRVESLLWLRKLVHDTRQFLEKRQSQEVIGKRATG